MPTDFATIRSAIVAKITTIDDVAECYGYDKSTLEGYPAVIVVPSDNEADYGSSTNDKVVFVFKARIYYLFKGEVEAEAAELALDMIVDQILSMFRERNILGSACDWIEPAPSVWEYEARGEAVYRTAEVSLKCVKYSTIT